MVRTALASHLFGIRERFGKSPAEVAKQLGIGIAEYYDLEQFDDLFSHFELGQIGALCEALNVSFQELFEPMADNRTCERLFTLAELATRVSDFMVERNLSSEQLGDAAGWDLDPFPASAESACEWEVVILKAVCDLVGWDWICIDLSSCKNPKDAEKWIRT